MSYKIPESYPHFPHSSPVKHIIVVSKTLDINHLCVRKLYPDCNETNSHPINGKRPKNLLPSRWKLYFVHIYSGSSLLPHLAIGALVMPKPHYLFHGPL